MSKDADASETARQARLAAALRANLLKRKARDREVGEAPAPGPAAPRRAGEGEAD